MKNGNKLLAVFLVVMMSAAHFAFASDSLNIRTSLKDSTKFLSPAQKFLLDSLNTNMHKMLPPHFQIPQKYPDSKMSFGPADNDMDLQITIAPAENSMDPKISIPLKYAPGPFNRQFKEKRDFRFPEKYSKRK